MRSAARSLAKHAAFTLLATDPALGLKLRSIARAEALTILNLHRVDDDRSSSYEAMLPRLFAELVGWLKSRFRIVTFSELADLKPMGKPLLILSFDDGYKDFVEIVMPILARHNVRANQNVIPGSVVSGKPPINVLVQDFIGQAPTSLLREAIHLGLPPGTDVGDRITAGLKASAAIKRLPIVEQKALIASLAPIMTRCDKLRTTPLMTLEDVKEAAAYHEIGAHSFEHASMAAETDAYLAEDASACMSWFIDRLALVPETYAFPNGSQRPGQADIVRDVGFRHVLSVDEAFSRPAATIHPRITMYGRTSRELKLRAVGAMAAKP